MATAVDLTTLIKQYGTTTAVQSLTLTIPPGRITALLGPSGCGKTTTLKMIAGLIPPTHGDILFNGERVNDEPAEKRSAVMVFQNHLLFPHISVSDNVAFGLRMRGISKAERREKAEKMLELVQLGGYGDRRPHQLSGGQQQRVALARALVINPHVLLLDEPLSNLDAHLRDEMRELIRTVQTELGVTTIFVTHDQEEAVILADQIALMFDGELAQFGAPRDFYERPHTERIARFFGGVNFINGRWNGTQFVSEIGTFTVQPSPNPSQREGDQESPRLRGGGDATLTIRPENITIVPYSGINTVTATVEHILYVGTHTRIQLRAGDTPLHIHAPATIAPQIGDDILLELPAASVHLMKDIAPNTFTSSPESLPNHPL